DITIFSLVWKIYRWLSACPGGGERRWFLRYAEPTRAITLCHTESQAHTRSTRGGATPAHCSRKTLGQRHSKCTGLDGHRARMDRPRIYGPYIFKRPCSLEADEVDDRYDYHIAVSQPDYRRLIFGGSQA